MFEWHWVTLTDSSSALFAWQCWWLTYGQAVGQDWWACWWTGDTTETLCTLKHSLWPHRQFKTCIDCCLCITMHSKIIHYLEFGIQLKYIYTYTERKRYTHTSTLRPNPHLSVPGPYSAILDKTHYTAGQDFTLHYHHFFGVSLGRSFCSLCPQSHWFSQQLQHSEVCSAFTCLCALWQPRGTPLSVKEAQTFHWSLIWTVVLFKFSFLCSFFFLDI